jgi:short-chain fatty acids transporter
MPESRLIDRIASLITGIFRAAVPDPFVIAVLLLVVACLAGLAFGDFNGAAPLSLLDKLTRLADAFRDNGTTPHIWSLLAFTTQMCMVLISGHVLASTRVVHAAIRRLADLPTTGAGGAALVGFGACFTGVINWGLSLIVGALLAREVGRSLQRRAVSHHYPIIVASGFFGLMVWHGGLSGSAPLTMTSIEGARRTLTPEVVSKLVAAGYEAGVPLSQTLFTLPNAVITGGLLVLAPLCVWFVAPRSGPMQACPEFAEHPRAAAVDHHERSLPDRLELSPLVPIALALVLAVGLWRFVSVKSLNTIGLNEISAAMLVLGLILHGSTRRFVAAVDDAATACGGIIVQFPIYAALIGVVSASGLIRVFADLAAAVPPSALPFTTFLSACVINMFVPSGGAQWAVQGPVALTAALEHGVAPGRIVMAVAYGDQLTNMLQPFWAVPLLAITGARARDIVGYTALVMLLTGVWVVLGMLLL